jgi:putative transposase
MLSTWRISYSLETEFSLEALEIALEGAPEVHTSDQGGQFTSSVFVARRQTEEIKINNSGRKGCCDNILVIRVWRTAKYEDVYLQSYSDGWEAEIRLACFLWRSYFGRRHSSRGSRTPNEVYTNTEP